MDYHGVTLPRKSQRCGKAFWQLAVGPEGGEDEEERARGVLIVLPHEDEAICKHDPRDTLPRPSPPISIPDHPPLAAPLRDIPHRHHCAPVPAYAHGLLGVAAASTHTSSRDQAFQ